MTVPIPPAAPVAATTGTETAPAAPAAAPTVPAAPAAGPATTVPQPLATPPAAPAAPAEPTATEPQGKAPTIEGEYDPERAKSTIANLRGKEKTLTAELADFKKRDEEFKTGLAKLLGLAPDEAPDPEKLTQQLNASQSETKQARVELAVYRVAGKHGADPDAVLDSRSFQNAVAQLDPTAGDFAAQVDAALAAAVETNPRLRAAATEAPTAPAAPAQPATPAAPAAGVSGAPITAPTEGGPITEQQLADLHARGDSATIAKLLAEGRLAHLL